MDWGIIAILIAGLIGALEVVSILVVRKDIQSYKTQLEERGSFGDQLNDWLTSPDSDAEGAPTKLVALASTIGKVLYRSTHMAGLQESSVDARTLNKYTTDIHEAVKNNMPPTTKILYKIADYLGFDLDEIIDREELPHFLQGLKNNGIGMTSLDVSSSSNQIPVMR